jgi:hypothetical protein
MQIVFAAVESSLPPAAFQQDNAEAGNGKFFGNDAAARAGPDHHRINVLERH